MPDPNAERERLVRAVEEAATDWAADLQEGYPAHGEPVDLNDAMDALAAFDAQAAGTDD